MAQTKVSISVVTVVHVAFVVTVVAESFTSCCDEVVLVTVTHSQAMVVILVLLRTTVVLMTMEIRSLDSITWFPVATRHDDNAVLNSAGLTTTHLPTRSTNQRARLTTVTLAVVCERRPMVSDDADEEGFFFTEEGSVAVTATDEDVTARRGTSVTST